MDTVDWLSPGEVADMLGHPWTWRHVLAAADPAPPQLPATEIEQVKAALAAGASTTELAELHNVSEGTIERWRHT